MTDVDGFLRAIAATPGDSLLWLILADYLQEQGRYGEEAGARWAAKHEKWPLMSFKETGVLGGWYLDVVTLPKHCLLPAMLATPKVRRPWGSSQDDLLACLHAFLERCGELEWVDGEPVGEVQHVA